MPSQRWLKVVLFSMVVVVLLGTNLGYASAQPSTAILTRTLLAKAQPDECFHGVGAPYDPDPRCLNGGVPKVNQAYVWGLTEANNALWFGTAPNVLCGVLGGFLGLADPIQTKSFVCEFAQNQSPYHSDFRPPKIYAYDRATGTLADKTPADPLILSTSGLRSAGNLNGVILLAGPAARGGGINMFAYNAADGSYLGSANLPQYSNIRRWLAVNGVLYAGVAKTGGGGAVLRWTGDLTNPFQVEEVGLVDSDAAELAFHQGRLFVNTWPTLGGATKPIPATLWMSPVVPPGGLTAADAATPWTRIFSYDQYDPDPLTGVMTGGGAMASFGGYLYWGTMHVPLMSGIYHLRTYYTNPTQQEVLQNLIGEHRAITIFRAKNIGTAYQKIELVYGDPIMPAYIPKEGWKMLPNKMKLLPIAGGAGFGNYFNNYTWTMTVYKNQLYVGTMDWSYLFADGLVPGLMKTFGFPVVNLPVKAGTPGADLWRFPSTWGPALAESTDGLGNPTSYGIRNLLVGDGNLYVGMANPMNLKTDPAGPLGGWELNQLTKP